MFISYVVVTALTIAANLVASTVDFARNQWILDNMASYGIPHSWLFPLGALKTVGALGLLAGFAVPWLGVAAAAGLVLYFIGAIGTVLRAGWSTDLRYPTPFLLLAVASLVLRLAA